MPEDELTVRAPSGAAGVKVRSASLRVTHGPDAGRTADIGQPIFVVGTGDGAADLGKLPYQGARRLVLDRFEEIDLPQVPDRADGVVTKAAELAGVARPSFCRMLERLRRP